MERRTRPASLRSPLEGIHRTGASFQPAPPPWGERAIPLLKKWRVEEEPVRLISEKLKVKEMGPADHIRTKHEVKSFIESGERGAAEELVKRVQARRELARSATVRQSQQQGQNISSE